MSDSLWPHRLQQARLPCSSPSPGACSNSCPLNQWCHPTISSSIIPFSSCLQSFPTSGSFLGLFRNLNYLCLSHYLFKSSLLWKHLYCLFELNVTAQKAVVENTEFKFGMETMIYIYIYMCGCIYIYIWNRNMFLSVYVHTCRIHIWTRYVLWHLAAGQPLWLSW